MTDGDTLQGYCCRLALKGDGKNSTPGADRCARHGKWHSLLMTFLEQIWEFQALAVTVMPFLWNCIMWNDNVGGALEMGFGVSWIHYSGKLRIAAIAVLLSHSGYNYTMCLSRGILHKIWVISAL